MVIKLIDISSSLASFLHCPNAEVVRQVLMRCNVSLIGSYVIRDPEFISISSYFLILPPRVMKKKLYTTEVRILQMAWIAFVARKV
jgi:hypothetical protein